jgi:hypothetical protein
VFKRAPEPTDVYWQNFGKTALNTISRQVISLLGSLFMIGISFVVIYFIKDYAKGRI